MSAKSKVVLVSLLKEPFLIPSFLPSFMPLSLLPACRGNTLQTRNVIGYGTQAAWPLHSQLWKLQPAKDARGGHISKLDRQEEEEEEKTLGKLSIPKLAGTLFWSTLKCLLFFFAKIRNVLRD